MRNSKYADKIIVGILLIVVLVFVIFAKNPNIKAGGSCLSLGLAILTISWIVKSRADKELFDFEIESKEILIDIAQNEENSEYFGVYNINVINKLRNKLIKRNRKQMISCIILGLMLVVVSIICFV